MKLANTILNQLGGNTFITMTGAKNLFGDRFCLSFRVMKNSSGITHVQIRVNSVDLYDLIFYKMWGTKIKAVETIDNVGVENLKAVFTDKTGLDTSL